MIRRRYNQGWSRGGMALLWDMEALVQFAAPAEVKSLREFFAMVDHWPEDLPSQDGRTLVVAGVEGCLEVLTADEAEQWLQTDLREAMLSFQQEYEGQVGLIFWLPSGRNRITMNPASEEYFYKHRGADGAGLPIGRLLWSGAADEVERIMNTDDEQADYDGKPWAGLHHPRIS